MKFTTILNKLKTLFSIRYIGADDTKVGLMIHWDADDYSTCEGNNVRIYFTFLLKRSLILQVRIPTKMFSNKRTYYDDSLAWGFNLVINSREVYFYLKWNEAYKFLYLIRYNHVRTEENIETLCTNQHVCFNRYGKEVLATVTTSKLHFKLNILPFIKMYFYRAQIDLSEHLDNSNNISIAIPKTGQYMAVNKFLQEKFVKDVYGQSFERLIKNNIDDVSCIVRKHKIENILKEI